jgi:hypothetical protein
MGAQVYQKQINRHTLRELVPVESYDEATGLFTTSDNYLGFGFVSRPLPGCDSSVTQRLNVLLTFDYPKESFIQVMLMGSQDIDRTLDNIKGLRKTKDAALNNSIHNRLAMLKGGSCESLTRHAPALIREFRLVITIKVPLEKKGVPSEKDVAGAKDLKISVEQTLKAVGLQPRVLDAEGFLRVVGQVLHWGDGCELAFQDTVLRSRHAPERTTERTGRHDANRVEWDLVGRQALAYPVAGAVAGADAVGPDADIDRRYDDGRPGRARQFFHQLQCFHP